MTITARFNAEPNEVIQFMLQDMIHKKPLKRMSKKDREEAEAKRNMRGFIHVANTKESLVLGQSLSINNYEFLEKNVGATHWTPFVYYRGYKNNGFRLESHIRYIPSLWVELDKEQDLIKVLDTIYTEDLPHPSLILESRKNRFHIAWTFDKPLGGTKKQIALYKYIQRSIVLSLEKLGADHMASALGYFRMPSDNNIRFFYPKRTSVDKLKEWANTKGYLNKNSFAEAIFKGARNSFLEDPAIQQIIHSKSIRGQKGEIGRYNSALTISLAFKGDRKSEEEARAFIYEWNDTLTYPLRIKELERAIKAAYEHKKWGKEMYAPSQYIVEAITGRRMAVKWNIITPKKAREERQRSHFDEWESDIIQYLQNKLENQEQSFIKTSWREMAATLNIPYSTFSFVIKTSKRIISKTIGKGRGAKTFFTLKTILQREYKRIKDDFIRTKTTFKAIKKQVDVCVKKTLFNGGNYFTINGPLSYLLI